jgi:glutathione S-transferase
MSAPLLVIGNKNYSSWSLRAWLALRKSDLEFTERRLPLDTAEFARDIVELSPSGKVPALWDGELCIWDSLAIAEYANEMSGGRLWPTSQAARAMARAVSAEMHSGYPALRAAMPMNCRAEGRVVPVDDDIRADIDRIQSVWSSCRSMADGPGDWLFGEFSIADAMYAPVALRFHSYGVSLSRAGQAYVDLVLSDPDVIEWITEGRAETEVVAADEAGL